MLLAETSITCAFRDALSDGEISSFHHTPEHSVGLESDDLKYECNAFEPIYSGDRDVGIIHSLPRHIPF